MMPLDSVVLTQNSHLLDLFEIHRVESNLTKANMLGKWDKVVNVLLSAVKGNVMHQCSKNLVTCPAPIIMVRTKTLWA